MVVLKAEKRHFRREERAFYGKDRSSAQGGKESRAGIVLSYSMTYKQQSDGMVKIHPCMNVHHPIT